MFIIYLRRKGPMTQEFRQSLEVEPRREMTRESNRDGYTMGEEGWAKVAPVRSYKGVRNIFWIQEGVCRSWSFDFAEPTRGQSKHTQWPFENRSRSELWPWWREFKKLFGKLYEINKGLDCISRVAIYFELLWNTGRRKDLRTSH